jgi:hypothetical protein
MMMMSRLRSWLRRELRNRERKRGKGSDLYSKSSDKGLEQDWFEGFDVKHPGPH